MYGQRDTEIYLADTNALPRYICLSSPHICLKSPFLDRQYLVVSVFMTVFLTRPASPTNNILNQESPHIGNVHILPKYICIKEYCAL